MPSLPSVPSATYRLQFHKDFTFTNACEIVPYLHGLGISHVYASPIFRANPGSMHGYDVCDHNQLNPELGNREEFDALIAALSKHGMKMILDFVPNHMGIAEGCNDWWMDVLENGPQSHYARYFDVDWTPLKPELQNKVLLPILGDQYGRVLEAGELDVEYLDGRFRLRYGERILPLAAQSTVPVLLRTIERLREAEVPVPMELESIVFGLTHLPDPDNCDESRMNDLTREKESARSRLHRLCQEEVSVENEVLSTLEEINGGGPDKAFNILDSIINAQHYRLASWKVAAEQINYRRFFDVNTLAALRMEEPEVFDATHKLLWELLSTDVITGLRIDHIDGLNDPRTYLETLQQRYGGLHETSAEKKPLYLLVEKILARGETLRTDWPVHGTTGYEFATQLTDVLVDHHAEQSLTQTYDRLTGISEPFHDFTYHGKLLVMRASMASEVAVLAHMLSRIAETNRWYRDFTYESIAAALREVIACFSVYRTYVTPDGLVSPEDRRLILRSIATARRKRPELERTVFEFIRDVYLPPENNAHPVQEEARKAFVLKLQQCTGAITAKGVEDTAFYIYTRLVALNEVGGEPGHFGNDVSTFHHQNSTRAASHPHCMLASSTHDTKRSEDVRARIAAISEMPSEWARAVSSWHRMNRKHRKEVDSSHAPDANEENLLYQTLLGSWPLSPMNDQQREEYIERLQHYMVKAMHEAKVNTSWIDPNQDWDEAVKQFVRRILTPGKGNNFEASLVPLANRIAELGAFNALSQTVLKLTSPGVPDIYQGQESWDFSLVDPDNRRPVDYELRQRFSQEMEQADPGELLREWRDGRIKFFVTQKLLQLRNEHPSLFLEGSYQPLTIEGSLAQHCIAYRRATGNLIMTVIVPRLTSQVGTPPIGDCWQDTVVRLESSEEMRNLFTGNTLQSSDATAVAELLKNFPVGVFVSE